jgi:hypothetical protein
VNSDHRRADRREQSEKSRVDAFTSVRKNRAVRAHFTTVTDESSDLAWWQQNGSGLATRFLLWNNDIRTIWDQCAGEDPGDVSRWQRRRRCAGKYLECDGERTTAEVRCTSSVTVHSRNICTWRRLDGEHVFGQMMPPGLSDRKPFRVKRSNCVCEYFSGCLQVNHA